MRLLKTVFSTSFLGGNLKNCLCEMINLKNGSSHRFELRVCFEPQVVTRNEGFTILVRCGRVKKLHYRRS
jgi:hypothetical protein